MLYEELNWASFDFRRWIRRLTLFYKKVNRLTPAYMLVPIPPPLQTQYYFRKKEVIGQIRARTKRFKSSFYPHYLKEWSILGYQIRNVSSVDDFKKPIVSIVRPNANSIFGIYNPIGLPYLMKLRTCLSKLNYHKFNYKFKDTVNPICPLNDGIEGARQFLLHCSSFLSLRRNLLARTFTLIRPFGFANLYNEANSCIQLETRFKFT